MNEEQLKEITILAKELGFKPCTMTTRFSFDELVGIKSNTSLVTDTCHYLLLCEIQLWLHEQKDHLVEITSTYSCRFGATVFKGKNPVPKKSTDDFEKQSDALATGILEGLKLIKNESN